MKAPRFKGSSWWATAREMRTGSLDLNERVRQECGPVGRIEILPGLTMLTLSSPEGMDRVLRTNQGNYRKPAIFTRALGPLTGRGLLTNETPSWHRQRRLIAPSFHHGQIANMVGIMAEETDKLAQQWRADAGTTRDVLEDMMFLTLNIVSRALFSTDVMANAGRISQSVRIAFEYAGHRLRTGFSLSEMLTRRRQRSFDRAKAVIDEVLDTMIRERRQSDHPGDDLLGLLIAARDEDTGEGMDDQQLRDELVTLMVAGHETTATALAWSWFLLAQNPEQDAFLGQAAQEFSMPTDPLEIRATLPAYSRWTFEESMRLYPPAPGVARQALAADEIHGFEVRRGAIMNCSFYAMFRDPELWNEPLRFNPERFAPGPTATRPQNSFVPFGLGARQCVGMNMAMVEGPLILALLAREFRLGLHRGQAVEIDTTFVPRPEGGLPMTIEMRA